jgi:hypothetical protein
MACEIIIPLSGDLSGHMNKVRRAVEKNGGTFTGDEKSGSFRIQVLGLIAGSYQVSNNQLHLIVENKPLFISCSQIENFLISKLAA